MGDKIESKRVATKAKVNMIPGFDGEIKVMLFKLKFLYFKVSRFLQTPDDCVKAANHIGKVPIQMNVVRLKKLFLNLPF